MKKDWKKGLTKKDITTFDRESKAWIKERNLVLEENLADIKHLEFLIKNYKERIKITKDGVSISTQILKKFKKDYGYK